MSVVVITRMSIDPANSEALIARHAALVKTQMTASSGLLDAQLGQVDTSTWVGIWRWESAALLEAARQNPPAEAAEAFALATDTPVAELVHMK